MKTQFPWIGRARGSAGGMTASKVYDKNVMRAKAFEVNNPNTQAQRTQRAFFAQLTALCADFNEEMLRILFPSKPKAMSRRNALAKQIAENFNVEGTVKSIDFASIDTLGNAPVMDFGTTQVTVSTTSIEISLDGVVFGNPSYQDHVVLFALVNGTAGQIVMSGGVQPASEETFTVSLPNGWTENDDVHVIPFLLNTTSAEILAGKIGTLGVMKRPIRKND